MTLSRTPSRPAARLPLAVAAAALLLPAVPALGADQRSGGTRITNGSTKVITCEGGRCEGTEQPDTIVASNAGQRVFGKGGDDDIELDVNFTSGSSDIADGGAGRDCIDGGAGSDVMIGGAGDDNRTCEFAAFVDPQAALTGGPGDDVISGGAGDDSMNGIFDDDRLFGGTGDDFLRDTAGLDKDRLYGGPGTDRLDARDGDSRDFIDGGPGRDDCTGDRDDRFKGCERVTRL